MPCLDISNVTHTDNISKLSAMHSATSPGFALACGENLSNQLGLGSEINDRKKPQVIKDLPEDIVQVAAGGMHSAVLSEDGSVMKQPSRLDQRR